MTDMLLFDEVKKVHGWIVAVRDPVQPLLCPHGLTSIYCKDADCLWFFAKVSELERQMEAEGR